METRVNLIPAQFSEKERAVVTFGPLTATSFKFPSGVDAVRLRSKLGEVVVLPFQGQQIWSVRFEGRELTMRSMFEQPYPTRTFLETFGGFLQHCGVTGVGGPGPADTHPLHGELPNAPYAEAFVVTGEDERGAYIGVGGHYDHVVAFAHHYRAEPLVKVYAEGTIVTVDMSISNRKRSPMELFYLAHVNFRPVDYGRILYSARRSPEHVRVRSSIPSHIQPGPGYKAFIDELAGEPTRHEVLAPDLPFDPEVVFFIDYMADQEGWAHTLQVHPDGYADYISHRPDQLPKATRWISRTPEQDAIALVEAGTSEPEGYSVEKAKGNAYRLEGGERFHCQLLIGSLATNQVAEMERRIAQITG